MRLLHYGQFGQEQLGVLDAVGKIRDLPGIIGDTAGAVLSADSLAYLEQLDLSVLPIVEGSPRFGPYVRSVGKFSCVGLNYSDHAAESGMAFPAEPVLFINARSTSCGLGDHVKSGASSAAYPSKESAEVLRISPATVKRLLNGGRWREDCSSDSGL